MSGLADAVRGLENRKTEIETELALINRKLGAIGLEVGQKVEVVGLVRKHAKGATTKRWYEPGEAAQLIATLAAKPIGRAALIRALAEKKANGVSAGDRKRLDWAAASAVQSAIVTKRLERAGKKQWKAKG